MTTRREIEQLAPKGTWLVIPGEDLVGKVIGYTKIGVDAPEWTAEVYAVSEGSWLVKAKDVRRVA